MTRTKDLMQALESFQFDTGDPAMSFTDRLARENHWSRAFAAEAMREYLRFIYLCVSSDSPCTPSDQVDQVWHLHLTYSRSYWDDLCAGVLGQPLHHGPTRGGAAEQHKYRDWYEQTLQRYEAAFGARPPCRLWPDVDRRFRGVDRFRRVNTRDYLLVSRRSLVAGAALTASLVAVPAAAANDLTDNPVVWVIVGAVIAGLVMLLVRSRSSGNKHGGSFINGQKKAARRGAAGGGFMGFYFGSDDGGDGDSGCGGGGCGGGGCGGD